MRLEQQDLETHLTQSSGGVVGKMAGGSTVATVADRSHLKDLVVAQQTEIDMLKNEIAMLRRKGGHVYTPVVAQNNNYMNSTGGGGGGMHGNEGYSPAAFAQSAPSSAPSGQQVNSNGAPQQQRFASSARPNAAVTSSTSLSPARPNGSAPTQPTTRPAGVRTPPADSAAAPSNSKPPTPVEEPISTSEAVPDVHAVPTHDAEFADPL